MHASQLSSSSLFTFQMPSRIRIHGREKRHDKVKISKPELKLDILHRRRIFVFWYFFSALAFPAFRAVYRHTTCELRLIYLSFGSASSPFAVIFRRIIAGPLGLPYLSGSIRERRRVDTPRLCIHMFGEMAMEIKRKVRMEAKVRLRLSGTDGVMRTKTCSRTGIMGSRREGGLFARLCEQDEVWENRHPRQRCQCRRKDWVR